MILLVALLPGVVGSPFDLCSKALLPDACILSVAMSLRSPLVAVSWTSMCTGANVLEGFTGKPVISILKPDTALYLVGVPSTVIFFRFNALHI